MLRDHEVELLEHLVRIVPASRGRGCRTRCLQDPEVSSETLVQAVRFAVLVLDLFDGEPSGVVRRLEWSATPKYSKLRRALPMAIVSKVSVPSRVVGVTVQDPVQVLVRDELRQLPFQGALDLASRSSDR